MKKIKFLTLGTAVVITMAGCSSNLNHFSDYKPMQTELRNAPEWVKKTVGKFQSKASAKIIHDEFELARTEATIRAKTRLAERIKSTIVNEVYKKTKKSIKNGNGEIKENLKQISTYYVNMALVDVKEKELWVSPKGNVWVLLEANPDFVQNAIQKAIIDTSEENYGLSD